MHPNEESERSMNEISLRTIFSKGIDQILFPSSDYQFHRAEIIISIGQDCNEFTFSQGLHRRLKVRHLYITNAPVR